MAWATQAQVTARTGVTVDASTLAYASAMISDLLGIDEEDSAPWLNARDLRTLRRATIYQAVYLDANPQLLTEVDTIAIRQPDLSITYKQPGASTVDRLLAPMAAKVLRHFRFAGPRSIKLESELTSRGERDADAENHLDWQPL